MEHRNFPRLSFFITAKPLEYLKIFPASPHSSADTEKRRNGENGTSTVLPVSGYYINIQNGGHVKGDMLTL